MASDHTAENDARPVSPDYAAGLRFAADVAHAEARWQTELATRTDDLRQRARHRYVAERATAVEGAIRAVAASVIPPGVGDRG